MPDNVATEAPSPYRGDAQPASRLPTSIADAPQTINVVSRHLIDERAGTTLREALRNDNRISFRSEQHTSALQPHVRISHVVFSLKKKTH